MKPCCAQCGKELLAERVRPAAALFAGSERLCASCIWQKLFGHIDYEPQEENTHASK